MKDMPKDRQKLLEKIDDLQKKLALLEGIKSDKENIEKALREKEEIYQTLVENSMDGILIIQDFKFRFVNSVSTQHLGYPPEELIGTEFLRVIPYDSREAIKKRYIERMAGKDIQKIYEIDVIRKDGTLLPLEINTALIEYEGQPADLIITRDITERKKAEGELKRAHDELEMRVELRTAELGRSNKKLIKEVAEREHAEEKLRAGLIKLKKTLNSTVSSIASIVESRDPYTAGHQKRVAKLSVSIARELGLSGEEIEGVRVAAILHDVGKIYVPAEILSKPGRLPEVEYSLIKKHCEAGYLILKEIDFPWPVAEAVHQHHETMDGSGYPRGLPVCIKPWISPFCLWSSIHGWYFEFHRYLFR